MRSLTQLIELTLFKTFLRTQNFEQVNTTKLFFFYILFFLSSRTAETTMILYMGTHADVIGYIGFSVFTDNSIRL